MSQVVARHINDNGGLAGHPVQIITADAAGDPARAASLVKELVEKRGVIAFVGNLWPLSGTGPRQYLEERGIPVIGGDNAINLWFQSPMYFPHGTSWPALSLAAAKAAVDAGKKKIGVLFCVEAEPCKTWGDTINARAKEVGAEVVYSAQVSLAQPDFTAECLQARRNGAEALMVGVESASSSRLARSCLQQGYKPRYYTGSLATTAATAKDPNLEGLGAVLQAFPFVASDLPGVRDYHAAIKRYAPTIEQSPSTVSEWTAGSLLRGISAQLPAGAVTTADLLAGLYRLKDETLGGLVPPLNYHQGKPASDIRCFFYMEVRGGNYTAPVGSRQVCI
jgi:branched-chain amino acid transport system substrate-binding protein